MVKTGSLVDKLIADYPNIHFIKGDDFYWSPSTQTVFYRSTKTIEDKRTLLHELAHGLLAHESFSRDVLLLGMEREAWSYAHERLAPRYEVYIDDAVIDAALDSYRDWLHRRSRCPQCEMNGVQKNPDTYRCLACAISWHVNDARRCQLRRVTIS